MIYNVKPYEKFIINPISLTDLEFDIPFLTMDGYFNKYNIKATGITHLSDNTKKHIKINDPIMKSLTKNKNEPYIISRTFKYKKIVTTIIIRGDAYIQINLTDKIPTPKYPIKLRLVGKTRENYITYDKENDKAYILYGSPSSIKYIDNKGNRGNIDGVKLHPLKLKKNFIIMDGYIYKNKLYVLVHNINQPIVLVYNIHQENTKTKFVLIVPECVELKESNIDTKNNVILFVSESNIYIFNNGNKYALVYAKKASKDNTPLNGEHPGISSLEDGAHIAYIDDKIRDDISQFTYISRNSGTTPPSGPTHSSVIPNTSTSPKKTKLTIQTSAAIPLSTPKPKLTIQPSAAIPASTPKSES